MRYGVGLSATTGTMTVRESSTLSALIAAYDEAVVFEESAPPSYALVRLFMKMRFANGGLVLFGVRQDGVILGVDPSDVESIYQKFRKLCASLTRSDVEIGTLRLDAGMVVFMVFNTLRKNLTPLETYSGSIERLEHF